MLISFNAHHENKNDKLLLKASSYKKILTIAT